jgi:sortase A
MNSILLGVEVAAVVGLIALVVYLFQAFLVIQQRTATEQLNAEATTIAAYVPPTATPIINVKARVLPSGHVFGEGADARFNLDEVPLEYRAQYQSLLDAPPVRPTPSPEGPIRIQIPAIAVDRQVVYGDDWEALKLGVGHHPGSVNPGQTGNLVLTAHNDVYGEIFRDLDKLKPGDQVFVSTTSKSYTYVIQETIKVKPTDTWVLDARGDIQQITLISCYPYRQNTQRIVLFGVLQS